MTTLSTKPLSTLADELFDFLGLAPDLGLPRLRSYEIYRREGDAGPSCVVHVAARDAAQAVADVGTFAAYAGGTVSVLGPFDSSVQPSGRQVCVSTRIVVVEVPIRVMADLDAGAYEAAMGDEPREVVAS